MKPAASETNAPRCPYCGYEMTLATEFNKQTGEPSCRYLCCNCYAESPSTEHVRYSLGLEEYEQHKRAAYELAVQRAAFIEAVEEHSSIPRADVVPVVRCKDCMYNSGAWGKGVWCIAHRKGMKHDDYCSRGRLNCGTDRVRYSKPEAPSKSTSTPTADT